MSRIVGILFREGHDAEVTLDDGTLVQRLTHVEVKQRAGEIPVFMVGGVLADPPHSYDFTQGGLQ